MTTDSLEKAKQLISKMEHIKGRINFLTRLVNDDVALNIIEYKLTTKGGNTDYFNVYKGDTKRMPNLIDAMNRMLLSEYQTALKEFESEFNSL